MWLANRLFPSVRRLQARLHNAETQLAMFAGTGIMFSLLGVMSYALFDSARCQAGHTGKQEVFITEKDSGKKVALKTGSTLIVKLEARPGTGYSWRISKNDPARLRLQGEARMERPDNDTLDGTDYQVFSFTAASEGNVRLELVYQRPWEKDAPPAKTFAADIEIAP